MKKQKKMRQNNKPQLCWDCARAVNGCSWSERFEPVDGWTAEEVIVEVRECHAVTSFYVKDCPLFIRDCEYDLVNKKFVRIKQNEQMG